MLVNNYNFCISYDKNNKFLKDKIKLINQRLKNNLPTVPVTLLDELNTNIFLRCEDEQIKSNLGLIDASEMKVFKKLRDLKDAF